VLVVVAYVLDAPGIERRRAQLGHVELSPELTFDFRPVRAGVEATNDYHDHLFKNVAVFEAACEAQNEGYSAVCIDTVGDSAVEPLRSVLDIPVIATGRSAYLLALTLGRRFSILTYRPWLWEAHAQLAEYGLADKCASVRAIEAEPNVVDLMEGKEGDLFPRFVAAAEQCIEDGADTIVLHSTTLHQVAEHVTAALGIPVVNPGPYSYKLAETMLGLGLSHSHIAYPRSARPQLRMAHTMIDSVATDS